MINLKQPENPKQGDGLRVRPLTDDEGRDILRAKFKSRSHWIFIAHAAAAPLIEQVKREYYSGARSDDFLLIIVTQRDETYLAVAARKSRMKPYRFRQFLERYGLETTLERMRREDLLIIDSPNPEKDRGEEIAAFLFDELAVAA